MPLPAIASIRCPRLTVRPVAAADLPDLLAVNGDDEVTRFLPYATWRGLDDARAWLARMEALRAAGGAQQLVIERRADGRVVGTVLLFKHDEGSARAEIGYVVGRPHWRNGYAREALAGVCGHAFAELGLRRIEAEVNPDNIASHRLLLALGFVHEGRLRQRWVGKGRAYDTNVYGCLAGEWPAPP
jgi:ribosomal-protein-alanine N-acetyltransferase